MMEVKKKERRKQIFSSWFTTQIRKYEKKLEGSYYAIIVTFEKSLSISKETSCSHMKT
jgi:hypothetical protein